MIAILKFPKIIKINVTQYVKISLQNIVDVKIKKKIFMKGEKTRKLETIIE